MKEGVVIFIFIVLSACSGTEPEKNTPSSPDKERLEVITRYDNGVTEKKGITIDGKREGLWESYYPSGYKWSEVNYRAGLKDGEVITYYKNGMMKYHGHYQKDFRSGVWVFYDTLGVVLKRIDMDSEEFNEDSIPFKLAP